MASFVKYQCFAEHLAEGVHNLDTGTLRVMLSNTAPNVATHTVRADVTELSTGNGYGQCDGRSVDGQWWFHRTV
jgi:exoribonuclease II